MVRCAEVLSANSEVVFSQVLRVANSATDSLAKDVLSLGRSFDLWVMVNLMQLLYLFCLFLYEDGAVLRNQTLVSIFFFTKFQLHFQKFI